MAVNQVEAVDVINLKKKQKMKFHTNFLVLGLLCLTMSYAQNTKAYKKKVLDNTELSWISGFYNQNGSHAATSGGIGTEKLEDVTSSVIVNIPINEDDILSVDAGFSAYSSASSSNINPFDVSGASGHGSDDDDDDDDDDDEYGSRTASPWVASSGASESDVYAYINANYSHSSDDRNRILSAHLGLSTEYDYRSLNFGLGYAFLWNEKNTTLDLKASVYLDQWKIIYPTELSAFLETGGNLNQGFFEGQEISPSAQYNPSNFTPIEDKKRNSYSASLVFSQILSPSVQMSVFGDVIYQQGLLSTPFHRVYFADRADYTIEDYQLADDREKLPDNRIKTPLGIRLNAYLSDQFILRSYYRFYRDDWDLMGHTLQLELPISLSNSLTISPMYRFYTQSGLRYFAPYEEHLSSEEFYTSDFDLADYSSNQIGGELRIAPPFGIWKIGKKSYLKNIILRYQYYQRDIDFNANSISVDLNFNL